MFDRTVFQELRAAATAATAADTSLATSTERAEAIKALHAAHDVLDGAESRLLAEFDTCQDFIDQGAPTTAAWARRELRMTGEQARMRVNAGRTLAQLPRVRDAAYAGQIRLAHVACFTAGITGCGLGVMAEAQDWLLQVARACDPAELKDTISALAQVVHPDELDEAWAKGMEKQDVKLAKVGDGYHLTGFLDILTGAEFKAWLDARSAPRDTDDDRTPSQRRLDALSELMTAALEHGLPTDKGIRPQLSVNCDLEKLLTLMRRSQGAGTDSADNAGDAGRTGADPDSANPDSANPDSADPDSADPDSADPDSADPDSADPDSADPDSADPTAPADPVTDPVTDPAPSADPGEPAELAGFGPIGDELLSYLICMADLTAILTNGYTTGHTPQANVLNVGRSWRLATMKQRQAVLARQGGICANPGCRHTHLEVHHVHWWSRGGATDLHLLVGLCRRCHLLVHQDKLTVTSDGAGGFTFARATGTAGGKRVVDHHRTTAHTVRRRIRRLTHPPEPARPTSPQPARCRHCGFAPHDAPPQRPPSSVAEAQLAGLLRRPRPHVRT